MHTEWRHTYHPATLSLHFLNFRTISAIAAPNLLRLCSLGVHGYLSRKDGVSPGSQAVLVRGQKKKALWGG